MRIDHATDRRMGKLVKQPVIKARRGYWIRRSGSHNTGLVVEIDLACGHRIRVTNADEGESTINRRLERGEVIMKSCPECRTKVPS